jgi:hypothetical protein
MTASSRRLFSSTASSPKNLSFQNLKSQNSKIGNSGIIACWIGVTVYKSGTPLCAFWNLDQTSELRCHLISRMMSSSFNASYIVSITRHYFTLYGVCSHSCCGNIVNTAGSTVLISDVSEASSNEMDRGVLCTSCHHSRNSRSREHLLTQRATVASIVRRVREIGWR